MRNFILSRGWFCSATTAHSHEAAVIAQLFLSTKSVAKTPELQLCNVITVQSSAPTGIREMASFGEKGEGVSRQPRVFAFLLRPTNMGITEPDLCSLQNELRLKTATLK